ncbi:MAG TPA: hypothetical protein VK525_17650 [Candidatus Saccharimonadales bacterium]|nr:hypothetical protein [Candidatus Saccharimonadales bacterium]
MNPANRKIWFRRIAFAAFFTGVGVTLSLLVFYAWPGTYPDDGDPKNIYYVLWKHGLNNNMNLDSALAAMSHDVRPVRRVEGLTKDQLKARFGYIRTLGEVTPYYQACYFTPGAFTQGNPGRAEIAGKSEDAFFLRDSPWMVVMKNGKAVDLILCKGY